MPRFYLPLDLCSGQLLDLPDTTVRHVQALRLRDGAAVTLFNGRGGEWQACLRLLGRREVRAEVGEWCDIERESPLQLGLVQGVSMGDRMDYTLQKAVELGVTWIQPLFCERAARVPADRLASRQQHWLNVVIAACEQSGRNRIPDVLPVLDWRQWLQQAPAHGLILSPLGQQPLPQLPAPDGPLALLAGPEGGLAAGEEQDMLQRGWTPVRLGQRILRTETAALAALAAMQVLWGDYRHV